MTQLECLKPQHVYELSTLFMSVFTQSQSIKFVIKELWFDPTVYTGWTHQSACLELCYFSSSPQSGCQCDFQWGFLCDMCVFVCAQQNNSYLNKEDPDLPVCFEQTVLVWIPLGFLWVCAPWNLVHLCKRTQVKTKRLSKLFLCKQVIHSPTSNKSIMRNKSWSKGSKIYINSTQ